MRQAKWVASAAVATVLALSQAGCTTSLPEYIRNGCKMGPNYHPPATPLPQRWIDDTDPRVRIGPPNLATWWEVFDDPALVQLIQRTYSSNLTLRAAGLLILAAREQRKIAATELLPQSQTGSFSYTHNEISATGGTGVAASPLFGGGLAPPGATVPVTVPNTPIAGVTDPGSGATNNSTITGLGSGGSSIATGGVTRYFDNWATGLNLSWELDFWGLFRRNLEAASANLDQSVFNSDEMTVLMLASVATQYVEYRTLQRRLELARKNVALQEPLVSQFEQRYKAGIANSYPGYYQLKSNLENTKALIPQLELQLRQANNQICTLIGIPVQDLAPSLGDGKAPAAGDAPRGLVRIPRPVDPTVVVGIPADLLLQRPDVRAAEQQLKIQSAEIGIAEAELLPHIGINGTIGLASSQFGQLFNAQSGFGSIGPSLNWSILNYGRLLANVRLQNNIYQQFVAEYQQAILNANQDAENALTAYLRSMEQAQHLRESADAAVKLSDYLIRQFKQGYLPPGAADTSAFINQIFTAVNFQVTQEDAAAQAEGNIALNLILLYRAMGGGWQLRLGPNGGNCAAPAVRIDGPDMPPRPFVPGQSPPETLPAPRKTAARSTLEMFGLEHATGNPVTPVEMPHADSAAPTLPIDLRTLDSIGR